MVWQINKKIFTLFFFYFESISRAISVYLYRSFGYVVCDMNLALGSARKLQFHAHSFCAHTFSFIFFLISQYKLF